MNRMFFVPLVWVAGLSGWVGPEELSLLWAAGPPPRLTNQRVIHRLVEQLGAEKFSERQVASKALLGHRRFALPALTKAVGHDDLEIRSRARKLIAVIDADVIDLRARGAKVKIDETGPDHPIVAVDFNNASVTDEDCRWLARQPQLREVSICQGQGVTDAGLRHFRSHPSLALLILKRAVVTDEGLRALATVRNLQGLALLFVAINGEGLRSFSELPRFRELQLTSTNLNDAGLEQVARLRHLKSLYITQARFTDRGMKHLAKLSSLEWLILDSVESITDAGILHLRHLKKLKSLSLGLSNVTVYGKAKLLGLMPWVDYF